MFIEPKDPASCLAAAKIVVVDDGRNMRKVVRTILLGIGVTEVHEARDGTTGLELIRKTNPDAVILDWQVPGMDGATFIRKVRSPGSFAFPDVPIIILTGRGERSRVVEAIKLGVNEFMLSPVSAKALQDRLISVLTEPREVVQSGSYYGPVPRKLAPGIDAESDASIAKLAILD